MYMYIYIYMCIYVYIYIYTFIDAVFIGRIAFPDIMGKQTHQLSMGVVNGIYNININIISVCLAILGKPPKVG